MKVIKLFVFSVAVFAYNPTIQCEDVVTMFMRPYPEIAPNEHANNMNNSLRQPGTIDHHILHGLMQKDVTSGIFSTYHGWLGISDYNGQTTFPRKQDHPLIYVLITPKLTPNIITGNTIHHWELQADAPAHMYKLVREDDPYIGVAYWNVAQVDLPKDNRVPLDAILIFAQPEYFYIPEGITVAREDKPNLILPDIYVKKEIKLHTDGLYVLNIRQFFGNVTYKYQHKDKSYSSLVIPHPGYQ